MVRLAVFMWFSGKRNLNDMEWWDGWLTSEILLALELAQVGVKYLLRLIYIPLEIITATTLAGIGAYYLIQILLKTGSKK